jgi:hypothetical protein
MKVRYLGLIIFAAALLIGIGSYFVWSNLPQRLIATVNFGSHAQGMAWILPGSQIDLQFAADGDSVVIGVGNTELSFQISDEFRSSIDTFELEYTISAGSKLLLRPDNCAFISVLTIPDVVSAPRKLSLLRGLNCYSSIEWRAIEFSR